MDVGAHTSAGTRSPAPLQNRSWDWMCAVMNANSQPTCAFENHANYKGDDYAPVNYTFAASLSRCCAFCKASQGCNV